MDTVYPQLVQLRLGTTPRRKRGSQNRYRTQPITFSEIKEVDEENTDTEETPDVTRRTSMESSEVVTSKSSTNVQHLLTRRPQKKISRKLQHRLDTSKTSASISTIPASPDNGDKNSENPMYFTPGIRKNTGET